MLAYCYEIQYLALWGKYGLQGKDGMLWFGCISLSKLTLKCYF